MLHPQFKTSYFEDEGWEREWIDEAKDIIQHQWETYYKGSAVPVPVDSDTPVEVRHIHSPVAKFTYSYR